MQVISPVPVTASNAIAPPWPIIKFEEVESLCLLLAVSILSKKTVPSEDNPVTSAPDSMVAEGTFLDDVFLFCGVTAEPPDGVPVT